MTANIPLGQVEGQKLEFKGKDALKHLPNVSREVVAMLNSGGGEIWLGLGEEYGRAVRIEGVQHPDREINRLKDHFCDAIEPSPIAGEIKIEPVDRKGEGPVLRIKVNPSKAESYALRDGTARHFLKRVDDRLRLMSREEVFQRPSRSDSAHHNAVEEIHKKREHQRTKDVCWLRIQAVGGGKLKFRTLHDYLQYFQDASKTGNRYTGWNFIDPYKRILPEQNGITFGQDDEICVRVFTNGAIEFTMPLTNLYWKRADGLNQTDAKEIWPYCLLEYPTSVFRLASTLYRDQDFEADSFLADLALFGLKGWTLRPYSPITLNYKLARPKVCEADEIVLDEPLNFDCKQIVEAPDRCAFRLVTQVYWRFGLWEEDMPVEFNQDTGKLILPGA